jgi:cell division protein FtsQ
MAGFELRIPAITLPGIEVKSRLLSLFLTLILGAALYLCMTLSEFRVSRAQVYGNQRISADEINSVLSTSGQPIFLLQPSDLETRLRLNYPEIASATVSLGLPNIVIVKVVERQPVILWQQGGGITWIDQSGVAFRPRGTAANLIQVNATSAPPPGLPVMNDPLSPLPDLSVDLVKAIETLAPSVPAGTAMVYDPKNGLGWSDARGWQVTFGNNAKDMALKVQVYQSLVASLTQQGITPAFISVQFANAPYYRMSQ